MARASHARRAAGEEGWHFHVLLRGELVHQVEGLKDEPDLAASQVREGVFGELADVLPRDRQLSRAPGRSRPPIR